MEELRSRIERFLQETNMKPSTFGYKAVNDGKFVDRIRAGGQCLPTTQERVLEFIKQFNPAPTGSE